MNMDYHKGQIVGYVPIDAERAAVPTARPKRWYVLKVFANREGKVMRTFNQRGISAYYPMQRSEVMFETRRFGVLCRRVKRTIVGPLFPGVIFIPDFQAKIGGVMVEGVDGYFRMDDCYPYLDEKLYSQVRTIEGFKNMPVGHKRRMLREGQALWVVDGPFAAFAATFDRLDSEGRLKVLVNIFGRMSLVTLDEDQIEPA